MRWRKLRAAALAVTLSMPAWSFTTAVHAADAPAADVKKAPQLSTAQQEAVSKLQAKGALVLPLAANSDALVVSLANAGKQGGDAELELIKTLPNVQQLDLRGTGVTDKGLASLEGVNTLQMLHLENTAVTDDGVGHLKGLTNLQYLNLFNTSVTDKGAAQLSGLTNLKKLYLWQTKVTDAGAASLKKSLPGVYINRGEELAATTQPAVPIAVAAAPAPAPAPAKVEEKKPPVAEVKPAAPAPAPPPAAPKPATPAPVPVAPAAPAPTAATPAKVDVAIEATVAAAKAAIDAKANEAKAAIDAKAAEAKIAIEKVATLRVDAAPTTPTLPAAVVASAKPINTKCPLSGDAVDPAHVVVFEGKTIGLCCEKCQAKFAANPKAFIDKVVADAR